MDALAALRCWAYEVTFPKVLDDDGHPYVFRIPPLPAADWIIATVQVGHLAYLPGLLDEGGRDRLMEALADDHITLDDIEEANREALEQISGWRWYSASRLIVTLAQSYETVGGLLVLAGVDPAVKSLGAVLAALYARMWIDQSREERAKLAQNVAMPPPSMLEEDNWDEEAAEAAVMAFMKAGGTGIKG